MTHPEKRPPMPSTPETASAPKSPEELAADSVYEAGRAKTNAVFEAARIKADEVRARGETDADRAQAQMKAAQEAGVVVAAKDKKIEPSTLNKAVRAGVATGVAGAAVGSKILGPLASWGLEKFKAGWQWLDVWDLSGSKSGAKAAKTEKPKK